MTQEAKYLPINFKPGIYRDTTEYAAEGYWFDMDRVRFRKGRAQSIGGWQSITPNTFKGIARRNCAWSILDGRSMLGLGTHNHAYIWNGGVFYDITPIEVSALATNILNTVAGATSVVVSIPSHGQLVNEYFVAVSQATTVGGNVFLPGTDYLITSVPSINSFVIETPTTAVATSVAAGGSFKYEFPLDAGLQSNNVAYGWGRGTWGEGAWGTAVSSGVIQKLRLWSMNNWGEDLMFNYKGGPLYLWDATNGLGSRGTELSAAPSVIDYSLIAFPTRHAVAYGTHNLAGTYDPMLIRWSDSENYNDWTASAANLAGSFRLQGGSMITGVRQSKAETLIWTDAGLYTQRPTNDDLVFGFDRIGDNTNLVSPMAVIDVGGVLYWMGESSFYAYNGQVNKLACTFQKDVFDFDGEFSIDLSQKEKTYCGVNEAFGEIIWFYQSVQATGTNEVDRYVIYNYQEESWYYGTMARTTWLDVGLFENTYATGTDGYLYIQELGLTANNAPLNSYLESAPFDLGDGDEMLHIDRFIPDIELTGAVAVTFTTRPYPNGPETVKGPYTVMSDTQKIDLRTRGRQAKITVAASGADSAWKLGKFRVRLADNGKR